MGRKFQKALEFKQGTIFNSDKDYIWLIITDITLRTITKESLGLSALKKKSVLLVGAANSTGMNINDFNCAESVERNKLQHEQGGLLMRK